MNCTRCDRTTDDTFLCWECVRGLRGQLRTIPWLVAQLQLSITRQSKLSANRVGGRSDETPVPFDERASDALDHLHTTLVRWVRDLTESRGATYTGADGTPALGMWLAHNVVTVMHSEDAGLLCSEVDTAVQHAGRAIDQPDPPIYRGPCPTVTGDGYRNLADRCGADLYGARGTDFVRCHRCGCQHDVRKLEQRMLAEMDDRLMTGAEIRRVMRELGEPVPESTFFHWRKTSRIQARGWMHDGRITDHFLHRNDPPVFRLGDVRTARQGGVDVVE
ncbi:hypothetical protein [Speluncibacter jeojiensis]|uniref:Helix-turn-helix DNA binding domain protein n=1 Tax=Speluncibacter jeojiensis TaxID=2710754 RepID=A0A9X4RCH3_9ACTN|nr:hypothetical protein [Corynebacteriales bacterium D3-21]